MKITLTDDSGNMVNAEVVDDNWVGASIEAAWAWMRHHGAGSVTARESPSGIRIATVALEIHDDE